MAAAAKICLAMIVKNETGLIRRCLDAMAPILDAWCIQDTGSTDGTQDVIRQHMAKVRPDIPGMVVDAPWRDFATNRNQSLDMARQLAREVGPTPATTWWILVMDADDVLHMPSGPEALVRAVAASDPARDRGLGLEIRDGDLKYSRCFLMPVKEPWKYVGVVHEVACHASGNLATLLPASVAYVAASRSGARSSDPLKYHRDAAVLEDDFARTGSARSLFYAAQSWRDAGEIPRSMDLYKQYARTPEYWDQERYISCLNVVKLEPDLEDAMAHAVLGTSIVPRRPEVPAHILKRYRLAGKWNASALGLGLAAVAMQHASVGGTASNLFQEDGAWTVLHDEVALHAHYLQAAPQIAVHHGTLALEMTPETSSAHARLQKNLKFFQKEVAP